MIRDENDFRALRDRRRFLREVGCGIGTMGLAHLLGMEGRAASGPADNPLLPKLPPLPAKAKNVIFMFMEGAPSQMDLFDPKPGLQKISGQTLPESLTSQLRLAFIKKDAKVLASPRTFKPYGQSGIEYSDYIPNIASCADDICLVRSMYTDAFNHHPGQLLLFTGSIQIGRPTIGAWSLYGLGSESKNLPGFVVLTSGVGTSGGASNFSSGFLPSHFQGTLLRNSGDPVLYLSNPEGVATQTQRATLDAIRDLNQEHMEETGDPEIASRIASYELGYRMQSAAPEMADLSQEPAHIREMYGIDDPKTKQFGTNCLMARRLVERGVRFVLMMHASWDQHTYLNRDLKKNCDISDKPTAALIKDLKQRGLLDSTLIVWGGEFGRTPMVEIRNTQDPENAGRDHHPLAYSMFLAGGGIKGGQVIGKTDKEGATVEDGKVGTSDFLATVCEIVGVDHTKKNDTPVGRPVTIVDKPKPFTKQVV